MEHREYVGFDLRREASIESNNSKDDENNNSLDLKRGSWTVEEDCTLINHIALHGEGRWNSLARSAGNFYILTIYSKITNSLFLD